MTELQKATRELTALEAEASKRRDDATKATARLDAVDIADASRWERADADHRRAVALADRARAALVDAARRLEELVIADKRARLTTALERHSSAAFLRAIAPHIDRVVAAFDEITGASAAILDEVEVCNAARSDARTLAAELGVAAQTEHVGLEVAAPAIIAAVTERCAPLAVARGFISGPWSAAQTLAWVQPHGARRLRKAG